MLKADGWFWRVTKGRVENAVTGRLLSRAHGFTVSAKPGGKLGGSVCVSVVGSFLERTAERRFRCVAFGVRMGGGALGLVRISLDGQAGTRGAAERREAPLSGRSVAALEPSRRK